jgi:transcriptional regulator with XRE-family HTH domain
MKLKDLRKSRGMSQQEIAKASGLSQPYISQIERGERKVKIDQLQAIAAALKVTVGALLGERN